MIKRTLYFGNPAYLKTQHEQLVVEFPQPKSIAENIKEKQVIPIEDIGLMVLDHQQITITQALLAKLLANNVALVTCDDTHHPKGMLFNLEGNTLQSQKYQAQLEVTVPLKKQLWAQTVEYKINNQAAALAHQKAPYSLLQHLAKQVKSGDSENHEAQAAVFYWKNIFPDFLEFRRERHGLPPNNLLNYGYAILRAVVARSLVGSGLLPTLGIHHKNQYNAYCLADDIMEPYRPYIDLMVCEMIRSNGTFLEMTPAMKKQFLGIPVIDVTIDGKKSPLMYAVQRTTSSLCRCYEGKTRKILFPTILIPKINNSK
jgi:CRISPR-associated protein Cas1